MTSEGVGFVLLFDVCNKTMSAALAVHGTFDNTHPSGWLRGAVVVVCLIDLLADLIDQMINGLLWRCASQEQGNTLAHLKELQHCLPVLCQDQAFYSHELETQSTQWACTQKRLQPCDWPVAHRCVRSVALHCCSSETTCDSLVLLVVTQ